MVHVTVLYEHIVRNPPDDSIAIELADGRLTHRNAIGLIHANGAVVERAFIDHFVVSSVAVDSNVLDEDVGDIRALEQRKIRATFGSPSRWKRSSRRRSSLKRLPAEAMIVRWMMFEALLYGSLLT